MIDEKCPHCGASMKKFWHRLTPGMTNALIKAYTYVSSVGENKFHLYNDLIGEYKLTTTEQMNWTKLRFHGLVAKYRENGEWVRGYWVITSRGSDYLKGNIQIPVKVQTFRNKVVDHDTELVTVTDVMRSVPYWQKDFSCDLFAPKQQSLI